jgi:predicted DNA-binding protein
MRFNSQVNIRLPGDLKARIDDAANRSARSHSDIIREGLAIGLAHLTSRVPADTFPPKAA